MTADDSLTLTILREIRAELGQHRQILLQLAEANSRHDRRFDDIERRFNDIDHRFNGIDQRFTAIDHRFTTVDQRFSSIEQRLGSIERRISETRDEIELMLKSELLGQLTHFETQIDEKIAGLAERMTALEGRESS